MSADNQIFTMFWQDLYHVWHGGASCNYYEPPSDSEQFQDEKSASEYARKLEEEIGYVEYGFRTLDKNSQIEALSSEIYYLSNRLNNLIQRGAQFNQE